jgi:hypothetical protein
MDESAFNLLSKINDISLNVISLSEIENDWHRKVRSGVTFGQYCWIWQPLFAEFLLDKGESEVTYLEADSMFFADPEEIFESIGTYDSTLAPHNYAKQYEQTSVSGKFITHFNAIKNTQNGLAMLKHWKNGCLEYSAQFPGAVPGQKCLDSVPDLKIGAVEITHPGVGVGPWNLPNWSFSEDGPQILVNNRNLIFYHFHEFAWIAHQEYRFALNYRIPVFAREKIYGRYVSNLKRTMSYIKSIDETFNFRKVVNRPPTFRDAIASFIPLNLRIYLKHMKQQIKYGQRYFKI